MRAKERLEIAFALLTPEQEKAYHRDVSATDDGQFATGLEVLTELKDLWDNFESEITDANTGLFLHLKHHGSYEARNSLFDSYVKIYIARQYGGRK